ncbi:TPA: phytanoyl-CoA dioxygenase family protein [Vibrio parahaemolyticus]
MTESNFEHSIRSVCNSVISSSWRKDGFAISQTSLESTIVAELQERANHVLNGRFETGREPWLYIPDKNSKQNNIVMYSHVHWADSTFNVLATSPLLGRLASQLLGVKSVRLWGTSLIAKTGSPSSNNDVIWHRDMTFWQCLSKPKLLTFWFALDDVHPGNGCLEFAQGSHRVKSYGSDEDLDAFTSKVIELRKGQMSVHHCLTGHRSNSNKTNTPRRAISIHLMDGNLDYIPGSPSDNHINVALIGSFERRKVDNNYFPVTYES